MAATRRFLRLKKCIPALPYALLSDFVRTSTSLAGDDPITNDTRATIMHYAAKRQTPVGLKFMLDFGQKPLDHQLMLSARFLHHELPVRLAHRVVELEALPYGLSQNPKIQMVRDWYEKSLFDIIRHPRPDSFEDDIKFTDTLRDIYERHASVVPVIAKGVNELKTELSSEVGLFELPEIHQFLDGFYMSRIGIRFLIGQHISIHEPPRENYIGMIDTKCSPVEVCRNAIEEARDVCSYQFGTAPKVDIYGDENVRFAYVPAHIHQMVFELVKNSLRAVQDKYGMLLIPTPEIRVIVAEGVEDVTIKVSDQGGGIPRSDLPQIWTYLYSTAQSPLPEIDDEARNVPSVLAGYGYGLPISRLYARYFGGDLQVISMEGYGTDAYLHLTRLGNVQEPLP